MNALLTNGIISEMECGNNFSYILNDSSLFLTTDYKVLQNQEDGCLIKCMKLLYNGKMQFYYLTNGYKTFADMIPALDPEGFIAIMTSVFSNILCIKENGFLSCQNIDFSFDRIFVDQNTYQAAFLYLPISMRFYPDEMSYENELRTELVKVLSEIKTLSSFKTEQFKADLANGMLSVRELYNRLKKIKTFTEERVISTDVCGIKECAQENTSTSLKMVSLNEHFHVELPVTKDTFVIGKNAAMADGVISFSNMISRIHCRINKEGEQYMITDLESKNGTYVNQMKLSPRHPHAIKNGDVVRLANIDFQIVIS